MTKHLTEFVTAEIAGKAEREKRTVPRSGCGPGFPPCRTTSRPHGPLRYRPQSSLSSCALAMASTRFRAFSFCIAVCR